MKIKTLLKFYMLLKLINMSDDLNYYQKRLIAGCWYVSIRPIDETHNFKLAAFHNRSNQCKSLVTEI